MKKRLVSVLVALTLAFGCLPVLPMAVTVAEEAGGLENVLFEDDFESYETDASVPNSANIYVYEGNTWSTGSAQMVVGEEYPSGNHVAEARSEGANLTLSRYFQFPGAPQNMNITFRVRPMSGTTSFILQKYGPSPAQSVAAVSIAAGLLTCFGASCGEVEMDKWIDFTVKANYNANTAQVYMNGMLMGSTESLFAEMPNSVVITCQSNLAADAVNYWDDVRVTELQEVNAEGITGDNLDTLSGVHPRLFVDADGFERIKTLTEGPLAQTWTDYLAAADETAQTDPPEYYEDSNPENLWIREVGTNLMALSMTYRVTGDMKYKEAADRWADGLMSYPSWGYDGYTNNDLSCGAALMGLSCYYDWLYDELSPNRRYEIVTMLALRGGEMARLPGWWREAYLQNHMWVSCGGLITAASAIYDRYAPAKEWFNIAKTKFDRVFAYLGENSDGASHEGIMYWSYGMQYMSYFCSMAKKFLNLDYSSHAYLQNGCKYFSDMIMPNPVTNGSVDVWGYGDGTIPNSIFGLIPQMAFLASYTKSSESQWFLQKYLQECAGQKATMSISDVFLFYDSQMDAVSPTEAGRSDDELFSELGFLLSRSGWEDGASVVAYRCGPIVGPDIAAHPPIYDIGLGHNHGDINNPWIYSRGDNLLAESGYGIRDTDTHSSLIVDGKVQEKLVTDMPQILKVESTDDYMYSIGDGTVVYPDDVGLKRFHRHFLYLKPDILILVDDVEVEPQDRPIPLQLRFFPATQTFSAGSDGSYQFENPNSRLSIKPVAMEDGVTVFAGSIMKGAVPATGITVDTENTTLLQPTVLSWSDKDKEPVSVDVVRENNGVFSFYTDTEKITLDVPNQTVSRETVNTEDVHVKLDGVLTEREYITEMRNDRFYMDATSVGTILGLETETTGDQVTFIDGQDSTVMTIGSHTMTTQDGQREMDAAPYRSGMVVMVPVRYVGLNFSIDVTWREAAQMLYFTTGNDFSAAKLKSLSVNGKMIPLEDGVQSYSVQAFGDGLNISAIPVVDSARVEIRPADTMFGNSEVVVTSPDETNVITYDITTEAVYGIGNLPICNMGYSTSDGNVGENVFDQNYETRWSANGEGVTLWMDLGEVKELDSMLIAFYVGNTRKTYFEVQVSNDGENYTSVGSFESSGTSLDPEKFDLGGVSARYVRYYGIGTTPLGGGWSSLTEMGVTEALE